MWALVAAGARGAVWSGEDIITPAERLNETRTKEGRLADMMSARGLGAILLTKCRNHAWLLGGSDTRIVFAQAESPVWLLVMRDGRKFLVASNMEAGRLMAEEDLGGLGWIERRYPWFAGMGTPQDERRRVVDDIAGGAKLGCDGSLAGTEDVGSDLARIRFPLVPTEMRKMRWLGSRAAGAVAEVCREIRPGMRETEIAALLAAKVAKLRITPTVVLIGTDERLMSWRHLTPTEAKLKRYALVNLCAEKWGLVVAVSRLVHFGPYPLDLEARMKAVAAVDAAYLGAARPGATFGEVFARGAEAYAAAGYPEEWRNHHQGGSIGYFEREALIGPEGSEVVVEGMCLAFNPTLPGVKVEDTVLVGPHGPEILTLVAGWPSRKVAAGGAIWERPDILVRSVPPAK